MIIRIGTRSSPLARAQAQRVADRLQAVDAGLETQLVPIKTTGDRDQYSPLDRPVSAGIFTSALTKSLLDGTIDLAVHSLKDLPLAEPDGSRIVALLERDDPADLLLIRKTAHDPDHPLGVKTGGRIGSSAPRRQSQLTEAERDIVPIDIRGNIGRRLALLKKGVLDALVIAAAVRDRLDLDLPADLLVRRLDPTRYPCAPGQGAIAVQGLPGNQAAEAAASLDHGETRQAVAAERAILQRLGGGCGLPLGAYSRKTTETDWAISATIQSEPYWSTANGFVRVDVQGPELQRLVEQTTSALRDHNPAQPKARRKTADSLGADAPALVITMTANRARAYQERLAAVGWRVVPWNLTKVEPTDLPPPRVAEEPFWIAATSPRAAAWAARFARSADGQWRRVRVAANGPATANALRRSGLPVHVVSSDSTGAGLARAIAEFPDEPRPIIWPAAQRPAGGLAQEARRLGLHVVHWPVYRTADRDPPPPFPTDQNVQGILVTSPSNAKALAVTDVPRHRCEWFAIGPTTAQALIKAGFLVTGVAPMPSPGGVGALIARMRTPEETGGEEEHNGHTATAPVHGKAE